MTTVAGELRLRSAVFDDIWPPGARTTAVCPAGHAAPDPGCACGVYAVAAPRGAVRYLVGRDDPDVVHRVLGRVALHGLTVEAERGWRAQHAVPLRIVVPVGRTNAEPVDAVTIAARLADAYSVPADVVAAAEPPALLHAFAA